MTIALFPGQGVQSAGMARGLVESVPAVFEEASDILGVDVTELCTEGRSGSADLVSTRWAQPAVLTCSVAAFRLADRSARFVAAAGHSVGEYSALVSVDALSLTDALHLVAERAEATDEAGREIPGGMAAVMRLERDVVEQICADHGVALAAENGPGQLVISGPLDELARAKDAITAAGGVCKRLDVSAAFHSPVMERAAKRLASALERVSFSKPRIDLWSTTAAAPVSKPEQIKKLLIDQLTSPVRWRETVVGLAQRVGSAFYDLGPGRVVAGLTKRLVEGAEIKTVADLVPAPAGGTT